jgi:hypothetical protein
MRTLPASPLAAWKAMIAAISDYTTDPLPRQPTGIDTTYIAVIRIDELTQLYAIPQQAITESQWATLGLADGVYLSAYLPDDEAPAGILGDDRTAVAGGERAGAAVRVVSWLEGIDDLAVLIEAAHETDDVDWLPTVADLAPDAGMWRGYFAASFNPHELKDFELHADVLDGRPMAFVRIAMESLEPA